MTTDDDLIRRGEVLGAYEQAVDDYNDGKTGKWFRAHFADAIAAIPAAHAPTLAAALATARADALREAAKWCSDEAERCDDASRWGGSRKYVSDCKAAAYALHNARHKIEALIPQEPKP